MKNDDVTILLVDDDEVDAMDIEDSLQKRKIGNSIVRAVDGVEALEVLRGENGRSKLKEPYLILLDIKMPRMDGLSFLKELRDDPTLKHSIVFVLTTSDAEDDRSSAYKYNVAGYLTKSDTGQQLLDKLQIIEDYILYVRFPPKI
ncbi:response regulator [Oligoflexia bacterium]|nr:response regulator [Oligoflexia bacterium]